MYRLYNTSFNTWNYLDKILGVGLTVSSTLQLVNHNAMPVTIIMSDGLVMDLLCVFFFFLTLATTDRGLLLFLLGCLM